jgi:Na+/H+ antiporter NhaC
MDTSLEQEKKSAEMAEKAFDMCSVVMYLLGIVIVFASFYIGVNDYTSMTLDEGLRVIIQLLIGLFFILLSISLKPMVKKVEKIFRH